MTSKRSRRKSHACMECVFLPLLCIHITAMISLLIYHSLMMKSFTIDPRSEIYKTLSDGRKKAQVALTATIVGIFFVISAVSTFDFWHGWLWGNSGGRKKFKICLLTKTWESLREILILPWKVQPCSEYRHSTSACSQHSSSF